MSVTSISLSASLWFEILSEKKSEGQQSECTFCPLLCTHVHRESQGKGDQCRITDKVTEALQGKKEIQHRIRKRWNALETSILQWNPVRGNQRVLSPKFQPIAFVRMSFSLSWLPLSQSFCLNCCGSFVSLCDCFFVRCTQMVSFLHSYFSVCKML